MPKKKIANGRALFYSRDSEGRHETTPSQYIIWAQKRAQDLGVQFDGEPETIERMIREKAPVHGDIYFDFGVSGNHMSRPALDRFLCDAIANKDVTHLFIPRRDRLARPDTVSEGLRLEDTLRKAGKTIVFMDKVLAPLSKRGRSELADVILATVEYDNSGRFRREHAQKMVMAQIRLAQEGYSTGGRAPYGFRRFLASTAGSVIRQLEDGEIVRKQGHHVVWLPGPDDEWKIIRRILKELKTRPASQVARMLTEEGVPSPDAGRKRTDHGVQHEVSGVWHQTTITNIARNSLLVGIATYGRRSMGDQQRYSPDGPRDVEDEELLQNGKPKVVRNPDGHAISAKAKCDPQVDVADHEKLLTELDRRAGTQRGKPRAHEAANNPLGCRVHDMNCSWPMYRTPYNGSYAYKCGLYQQSHGAECSHNKVNGPQAVRFVMGAVRQRILSSTMLQRLQARLHELAIAEREQPLEQPQLVAKRSELKDVEQQLAKVERNLALAESPQQYQVVAKVFEELQEKSKALITEVAGLEKTLAGRSDNTEVEVTKALELLQRLPALAQHADDHSQAGQLFKLLNVGLYLQFGSIQKKKRKESRVLGGILTFGDTNPPINLYQGPTSRRRLATLTEEATALPDVVGGNVVDSEGKDELLGNVSRGDRI